MPGMKQTTQPASPFGAIANKSAESLVTEAKAAPADDDKEPDVAAENKTTEAAVETVEVELIHHWNDENGKARLPGEKIALEPNLAATLVGQFYAKPVA